jgi:ATP-dependent protease ClpP protease subunit
MNWFSIHRHEEVAYVSIFGDIGCFGGLPEDFAAAIGDAPAVDLTINCCGGDSVTALAVYDLLKTRKCRATIIRAYSSATTITMAAEHISIVADGKMMVHSPCEFVLGDPEILRWRAGALDKTVNRVAGILADRTEQPRSVVDQWLSKDTYFDAGEALASGLVDEIESHPASLPALSFPKHEDAEPAMHPSEQIFNEWLRLMPHVTTRDRAKFIENLQCWVAYHLTEEKQNHEKTDHHHHLGVCACS